MVAISIFIPTNNANNATLVQAEVGYTLCTPWSVKLAFTWRLVMARAHCHLYINTLTCATKVLACLVSRSTTCILLKKEKYAEVIKLQRSWFAIMQYLEEATRKIRYFPLRFLDSDNHDHDHSNSYDNVICVRPLCSAHHVLYSLFKLLK